MRRAEHPGPLELLTQDARDHVAAAVFWASIALAAGFALGSLL